MKGKYLFIIFGVLVLSICFRINNIYSHCDTLGGPVIKEAQKAFETGDITPVLKWVPQDKEEEVIKAFNKALTERNTNKEAVFMKFYELIVRIHRESEGAEFTGIKPAGAIEPIEAEADKALESGTTDELFKKMSHHLGEGLKERFDKVIEKTKRKDESVELGREYVKAYVEYLHYIEGIHKSIAGGAMHQHKE